MVAEIDEQHAAMVANAMAPAGQANGFADIAVAERAAGMGPVTMHGVLEPMVSESFESRAENRPETRERFTRGAQARQPNACLFRARKTA
jgi:hypothetical protein